MDSEKSIGKTETLCRELNGLWGKAGMVPRKWLSNDTRALASIPHENRAKHISIDGVDRLPVSRTLGLTWDAQNDMLIFKIAMPSNIPDTKRTFLKVSAAIFDPMGFISPFTVVAKILMQSLWLKRCDWDDKLDSDTCKAIEDWIGDLK